MIEPYFRNGHTLHTFRENGSVQRKCSIQSEENIETVERQMEDKPQSTYSREEGNEWEKDRRNKIPKVKIRQTIAQESVWKALLTSFCISRAVTA
jgi:hypothetical protein